MSKRFNFSINMEDDSLFEKSIQDAITSYAKQQVRKSYQQEIQEEVERLVTKYSEINGSCWNPTRGFIESTIRTSLQSKLNSYMLSPEFKDLIDGYVRDVINRIDMKSLIMKHLNNNISSIVSNLLTGIVEQKSNE